MKCMMLRTEGERVLDAICIEGTLEEISTYIGKQTGDDPEEIYFETLVGLILEESPGVLNSSGVMVQTL